MKAKICAITVALGLFLFTVVAHLASWHDYNAWKNG